MKNHFSMDWYQCLSDEVGNGGFPVTLQSNHHEHRGLTSYTGLINAFPKNTKPDIVCVCESLQHLPPDSHGIHHKTRQTIFCWIFLIFFIVACLKVIYLFLAVHRVQTPV